MTSNAGQLAESRDPSELSLVEIAEQLEKVTGWIETQRVREREARAAYDRVRQETESNISRIRDYAKELVKHQQRKMSTFSGILGQPEAPKSFAGSRTSPSPRAGVTPKNLAEAILAIWSLDRYREALTTEDIAAALKDVGYQSDAAEASIRSSVNQALAKLCGTGRVVRLRADGSPIPPRDKSSRARKYIAATRLPEDVVL
jgi:hypothetical protein